MLISWYGRYFENRKVCQCDGTVMIHTSCFSQLLFFGMNLVSLLEFFFNCKKVLKCKKSMKFKSTSIWIYLSFKFIHLWPKTPYHTLRLVSQGESSINCARNTIFEWDCKHKDACIWTCIGTNRCMDFGMDWYRYMHGFGNGSMGFLRRGCSRGISCLVKWIL